jgi:hypothetical protein
MRVFVKNSYAIVLFIDENPVIRGVETSDLSLRRCRGVAFGKNFLRKPNVIIKCRTLTSQ